MGSLTLKDITTALESTHVTPNGVSFAGKCLKLNTEDDAKPVIDAINECQELQFLNLEGNTLGVEASRAIAKALEQHPEFKQALWKDMFTGRMKTEIPIALQSLGNSLVTAGAHLTELDLSDNAFGPIGVQGLASLLCSSACYALEELRLNNNGLGIGGGKLLAGALLDCYKYSKQHGKALSLKVFIAGRNRLENDGAKALAEVFKTIGTLEEIAMPQNGIYHVGIGALSEAFKHNKNLQILNLNDNTVGPKGSKSIANVLPYLKNLKEINFGDCLLKTKGAQYIAEGLKSCDKLEQVTLGYNEIKIEGGKDLVKAMSNKSNLKSLTLNGNQFGSQGVNDIKNLLKEMGKLNILGSLDENENSDSEDESVDSENDSNDDDDVGEDADEVKPIQNDSTVKISISEFLSLPNGDNLLGLGDDRVNLLIMEAEQKRESYLEHFVPILMKVAALTAHKDPQIADISLKCAEELYKKLFSWAQEPDRVSVMNNALLVHLGLIKSEDKKFKPTWNIEGCLVALRNVLKKNYVPNHTRNTLKVFMQRDIYNNKEYISLQKAILSIL